MDYPVKCSFAIREQLDGLYWVYVVMDSSGGETRPVVEFGLKAGITLEEAVSYVRWLDEGIEQFRMSAMGVYIEEPSRK